MKKILLLLVFAIATISLAQAQTTIYVTTGGNDASAGTTWGTAFRTVQKALSAANANDQIWVATGTYYPDEIDVTNSNNRDATFLLKNGVALYGGFAGTEALLTDRPSPLALTTLSGDINQSGNLTGNSHTVVTGSGTNASAVIDGFTITGGNADKSGVTQVDPGRSGGGMYNEGGSPTVTNCTFSDNQAASLGGGMYNSTNSSPTVTNCIFAGNSAAIGGGMRNSASSPTVINCTFTGNSATNGSGGGMLNVNSSPTITNCTFSGNTSTGTGANGGGIANANLNPSAITNPTITNTIIWNNSASGVTNTASASISNTNNPMQPAPNPVISHSIIANSGGGGNNKDVDPLFVAPLAPGLNTGGNYRLRPTSPAINMGNNAAPGLAGITTDLDLDDRIFFNIVDMGAYEVGCDDFTFTNQVAYVDAAATGGNKDGSNWTNAFTDLQNALTVACNCPGKVTEIWVAEGTYYPDEGLGQTNNARASGFNLCSGVNLYGGFQGIASDDDLSDADPAMYKTILSGDLMKNDGANFANTADNAWQVVRMVNLSGDLIFDGFIVEGGNGNGAPDFTTEYGAGIYISAQPNNFRPTIRRSVIRRNQSSGSGGGVFVFGNVASTFVGTVFTANKASTGGGVHLSLNADLNIGFINCVFYANEAFVGGGLFVPRRNVAVLLNTTMVANSTPSSQGGGIFNEEGTVIIRNSILWGNTPEQIRNNVNN